MNRALTNPGPRACLAAALLTLVAACDAQRDPPGVKDARRALVDMIEAHGGAEALGRFRSYELFSEGVFKGSVSFRREVHFRDPDHWSMSVDFGEGALRAGVFDGRCWTEDRNVVKDCAPGEQLQLVLMALRHNAWVLDEIDASQVEPADSVDGLQAIRSGDTVLAFDPDSHLLAQIRHGDRVETLTAYRTIDGARIATHRELTIAGEHDLKETWTEIEPGVQEPRVRRPPAKPTDGTIEIVDDPARIVAWSEVASPTEHLRDAVNRLDDFVKSRDRKISFADGIVWLAPPDEGGTWRLAVGVEGGAAVEPLEKRGFHLDVWPGQHMLLLHHRGDLRSAIDHRDELRAEIARRGLEPLPGAVWQIRAPRSAADDPPDWGLVQIGIAVRPPQ